MWPPPQPPWLAQPTQAACRAAGLRAAGCPAMAAKTAAAVQTSRRVIDEVILRPSSAAAAPLAGTRHNLQPAPNAECTCSVRIVRQRRLWLPRCWPAEQEGQKCPAPSTHLDQDHIAGVVLERGGGLGVLRRQRLAVAAPGRVELDCGGGGRGGGGGGEGERGGRARREEAGASCMGARGGGGAGCVQAG